jgi:hypothetical protein
VTGSTTTGAVVGAGIVTSNQYVDTGIQVAVTPR